MELILNNKTYTLRNINSERRQFFVNHILPNYQIENEDEFFSEIQKSLQTNHKIEKPLDQIKKDFFKQFGKILNQSIWMFLFPEDKKELGIVENINVSKDESVKFINWLCNFIKKYTSYVGSTSSKSKSEDIETILSFVSSIYGWTFDEMKEMDELELLKAVEQAIEIKKKNQIEQINSNALAGAYASGSKKAKTEIDKLNRNLNKENQIREIKKVNPEFKMKNELSRDQLEKLMNYKRGGNNGN